MTEIGPKIRRIGYARVSTYGQTLDAQLEQLKAAGCAPIYREKAPGARADRRELLKMLGHLTAGDVVTVTRIDRLEHDFFKLSRFGDSGAAENAVQDAGWKMEASIDGRTIFVGSS